MTDVTNIDKMTLHILMRDGSQWQVPLNVVARNRAAYYAHEFDDSIDRSLAEDTIPLFVNCPEDACDWALNNMNWVDLQATKIKDAPVIEPTDMWSDAELTIYED